MGALGCVPLISQEDAAAQGYATAEAYAKAAGMGQKAASARLTAGFRAGTLERIRVRTGGQPSYAYRERR